ncbi:hypothetical protein NXC14_CH03838 [Rhizobium sp. NXC14]|nr:hypothetical protein NXC14_CH03838 [Rhizobium sp. NXC14]
MAGPVQTFAASNIPDVRIVDSRAGASKGPHAGMLAVDIPGEVLDAIKNASVISVIPINSEESFGQQVIKADQIVFAPGSRMVLKGLNYPWIAVVTKQLRFSDPSQFSFIMRDPAVVSAADGNAGTTGSKGLDGTGEVNRQGNPGLAGQDGTAGEPGATQQLPTIYIIAGEILDPGGAIPGFLNFGISVAGINGGDGARGGTGGAGGPGARGKEGASSLFDCKEGPGRGGRGGDGGRGGRGGDAGNGGNGANIVYVTLADGMQVLSYARVNDRGGLAGAYGMG